MKTIKITLPIFVLLLIIMVGCEPKADIPVVSAGSADFSSYVAIGSSFSSGFADGALSKEGQKASFPNLLAERMKLAGGADTFNIPLLKGDKGTFPGDDYEPGLFNLTEPKFVLRKKADCKGEVNLLPERLPGLGDNELDLNDLSQRIYTQGAVFHHLGIPAMKVIHFTSPGYANLANFGTALAFNPYFWRFAPEPLVLSSPFNSELIAQPTFYTVELGMSDVLAYAIAGGAGKVTGNEDDDITSLTSFRANLAFILDQLVEQAATGVIANIPDITTFPHFSAIEYDASELDSSEVAQMNIQYSSLGLTFIEGDNPFVIREDGIVRKVKSNEFILLGSDIDSLKCMGLGSFIPLSDQFILSEDEIANVKNFTIEFNIVIDELAAERGIAMVDLASFFATLHGETTISGIDLSTEFVSGAFFSLDGLHPNNRGQALIANEFLKVINSEFSAQLPLADISIFSGTLFP